MALARRRTSVAGASGKNNRWQRPPMGRGNRTTLEPLEVRRLLSALDVTSVVWGNLKQDVVRNEYIIQTAMPPTNLNATLNRHGEARGLPYLAIEVRNDLIADAAGVARWTDILAPILIETRNRVA